MFKAVKLKRGKNGRGGNSAGSWVGRWSLSTHFSSSSSSSESYNTYIQSKIIMKASQKMNKQSTNKDSGMFQRQTLFNGVLSRTTLNLLLPCKTQVLIAEVKEENPHRGRRLECYYREKKLSYLAEIRSPSCKSLLSFLLYAFILRLL